MSIEALVAVVSFIVLVLSWMVLPGESRVSQVVDEGLATSTSSPALVTS